MNYLSRLGCQLRPPKAQTRLRASAGLAVHYNGPPVTLPDHSFCDGFWRGTQNFHMDSREWADVAYSWGVCPHGGIFEGRGWGVRTAANGTSYGNSNFHAVMAFLGEGQEPTDEMLAAILEVHAEHDERFGASELTYHSAFKSTDCPGEPLTRWVRRGAPAPFQPEEDYDMPLSEDDVQRVAQAVWSSIEPRTFLDEGTGEVVQHGDRAFMLRTLVRLLNKVLAEVRAVKDALRKE